MTKISFYLFEQSPERQVASACRLCRKILRQAEQKIWLYCKDPALQQQLDDQLWCFDPMSFIAHGINQQHSPVCISAELPEENHWIVFNFNKHTLEPAAQISQIIEIVENNDQAKQLGREKFKQYRKLGIMPKTYKL